MGCAWCVGCDGGCGGEQMKSFKIKLLAGEERIVQTVGNYLRFLSGDADVKIRLDELNVDTKFKIGVGVRLDSVFTQVAVSSEVDQVVEMITAMGFIDDSRLTGDVDVNGLLSVVNAGGSSYSSPAVVSLLAGVASSVLSQDTARLKASIQADVDIFVGGDVSVSVSNGLKLLAGQVLVVDNTAQLFAVSALDANVVVLEEYI